MVKVRLLGYYAEIVGVREFEVKVDRIRVLDLVKLPGVPLHEPIILVNGKPAKWDDVVGSDDVVVVMPPVGGG